MPQKYTQCLTKIKTAHHRNNINLKTDLYANKQT